jgi:prophage DNA circulation protein
MTRAEKLWPAAFRGVPFQVDDADISAGRRVQVHEYPQRDKPYVEDIGRATREFNITGFVIGDDYVDQANALLNALEQPGTGLLLHPWHGNMDVTLKGLGRIRYSKALGYATIEMTFVESGDLEFPSVSDSTQSASALAADALGAASVTDFASRFNVAGAMDYVNAAARGDIQRVFQLAGSSTIPGMSVLGYANNVLNATQSALLIINNPTLLGNNILGAFGVFTLIAQGNRIAALLHGATKATAAYPMSVSGTAATPSSQQQQNNTAALNDLCRRSLLVQAVGLSSQLPAVVHDDVIAMRGMLMDALDTESLTAADGVYQALADARTAVWQDLTSRAQGGARLTTLTRPITQPMVAIAYDYYGDATRDAEIIQRNNVRNPLFVPHIPLQVLTA